MLVIHFFGVYAPLVKTHVRSTSRKSRFEALRHNTNSAMQSCPSMMANSSIC